MKAKSALRRGAGHCELNAARSASRDPAIVRRSVQRSELKLSLVTNPSDDGEPPCEDYQYSDPKQEPYNWFRKHDDMGNVVEDRLYWADDSLVFRWVYVYDQRGIKVEAQLYNAQRSLLVRCLYDDKGKLVRRLSCNEGNWHREIEYEYDSAMKFVGSHIYNADGSRSQSAYLRT